MAKFNGFGGGFGGGGMANLMRQAQKMQQDMQTAQEELKSKEFTSEVGGGMVQITVTGEKNISSLKIDPKAVDPDDVEMLEDLIIAALKDAFNKVDEETQKVMGPYAGILGGLN